MVHNYRHDENVITIKSNKMNKVEDSIIPYHTATRDNNIEHLMR